MNHNFTSNETHTPELPTYTESLEVTLDGDFDGGTLTMQLNDTGPTDDWYDIKSWTSEGSYEVPLGKGREYRFTLAGAGSPDLDVFYNDIKVDYKDEAKR